MSQKSAADRGGQKGLLSEEKRIEQLKNYEKQAYEQGYRYIAGIDEVGRGPIAGPVVAAAVILPSDFFIPGIDDSKRLSASKRLKLYGKIKQAAVSWAVAAVYPSYLDRVNIYNATCEAMSICVQHLTPRPDFLLIDAVKLSDIKINQLPLIKGDSLSVSIACASILAKVERDRAMDAFELLYPGYYFSKNKGYATREHIEQLLSIGPCSLHRQSFEPVKSLLRGGKYVQPGLFDQRHA